jgi:hypothetical protein
MVGVLRIGWGRALQALVFGVLLWASPPAWASVPLSWSAPVLVDAQPPYSAPRQLSAVSCTAGPLCVAVDRAGNLLASTNPSGGASAWSRTNLGYGQFSDISCASASLCVAVDYFGDIFASSNPTGAASAWRSTGPITKSVGLNAVSCPSASLCVAVDGAGDVLTSTDPTGGASTWTVTHVETGTASQHPTEVDVSCASASLCVVTDDAGNVITSTDPTGGTSAWTVTSVDPDARLGAVSCASASLCVAVDSSGNVVTSSEPRGGPGTWSIAHIDSAPLLCGIEGGPFRQCSFPLSGVSCVSESSCVAVDSVGNVLASSNPTGGASAWTSTSVETANNAGHFAPEPLFIGISCVPGSLCVAVDRSGGVATSTNPTGSPPNWSTGTIEPGISNLDGVSCPSVTMCVAVDAAGKVLWSTSPAREPSSWRTAYIDSTPTSCFGLFSPQICQASLTAVSCASVSFCAAVDSAGDVLISTAPAAGGPSWRSTRIDAVGLTGIACPSRSLCVATDSNGRAVASTDPTGGQAAWKAATIAPKFNGVPTTLTAISCPSVKLCVATGVTPGPSIITSTNPARGAGAWKPTVIAATSFDDISCSSPSLCVALQTPNYARNDISTTVDVSTAPTRGSATWKRTTLDGHDYGAVSCTSVSVCVVLDSFQFCSNTDCSDAGNVMASSNPAAGASTWKKNRIRLDGLVTIPGSGGGGLSCPALWLCVAVDTSGGATVGSAPPSESPTADQIERALAGHLTPLGSSSRLRALLGHDGYSRTFDLPSAGQLVLSVRTIRSPATHRPLLVAAAVVNLGKPGLRTIKIELTRSGKQLLKRSDHLELIAQGSFAPTGQAAVIATTRFHIHR